MCNSVQYALHMRELMAEIRAAAAKRKAERLVRPAPARPLGWALRLLGRARDQREPLSSPAFPR